jgi:carboxyl-terminal processing protease
MLVFGVLVGLLLAGGLVSAGFALGFELSGGDIGLIDIEAPIEIPRVTQERSQISSTPLSPEQIESLFVPFWEAWDIVHESYVDQPVDNIQLMQGAIRGMLDALGDQHTSYMDPDEYANANAGLVGYEGIGAWVDPDTEYLTIIAPIPGSPAEAAGLLPGDEVIAVDGEDMSGVDGNVVITHILGPEGTEVSLTIRREGVPEPLEFNITRARIDIPSVTSEILEGDVAYVQLFSFGDETTRDLRAALEDVLAQDPVGLILDLRNNGGGFLNAAVQVTSEFIDEGLVAIERFGDGREQRLEARPGGLATEVPLIVLINGGSASASEIVAGAIQDYERGLLVGETSFGKGSVQEWIPLSGGSGAVRVTIARWYTPNDRLIHEEGLAPDVEVSISEQDFADGLDPQLDEAILILKAGLDEAPPVD